MLADFMLNEAADSSGLSGRICPLAYGAPGVELVGRGICAWCGSLRSYVWLELFLVEKVF